MEGFAGVRVKLGSHCFSLVKDEGSCSPFPPASFWHFLGAKSFCARCHCCAEAADPIPAFAFPAQFEFPLQVPWEYPPCTCIIISSQDGSYCKPINTYLSLDSCRWRNPNTPTFRYYSLELHSMRWKEIMGGNLFVQITPALG